MSHGVLRVQRGRAPNCSSAGSVVGAALVSAVAGAAVWNAFASAFARWAADDRGAEPPLDGGPPTRGPEEPPRLRLEPDGPRASLLAWNDPPALLELDEDATRAAMAAGARVVGGGAPVDGALSAPTEAHLAVTTRCPVACKACYLDASPDKGADADRAGLDGALDELAALGVLEVAFGGGEAGLRDDALALAARARARGMVPNLTTSGFGLAPPDDARDTAASERARAFSRAFGQVNVSIDGLGPDYVAARGWDGAATGLRAVRALADAGGVVGVNTVLTRANVEGLEALADALVAAGAREWQWLRLKPAGRGAATYDTLALRPDEAAGLWPRALAIEARTGLTMRFDCALVPFLAMHGPHPEAVERLGVRGCVGGSSLWARSARGGWAPCSFAPDALPSTDLSETWRDDETLRRWRVRAAAPAQPCDTCEYQRVCRGGCRIVASHLTGDSLAPDPECPRVRAHAAAQA
jgi:radical SAM protein with 4Fe4S-binding SPASM domain